MQFWSPDDEHMCSKHVEAWNKLTVKQKFCASSCLITEINILRCTVSKTSKYILYVYDLCCYLNTQTLYLSLCLITDQGTTTYNAWRLGSTYPSIGSRCRRVVSFTHRPLWHWGRALFSFSMEGRQSHITGLNTSQKRETHPGIPSRFHGDPYILELCHENWIIWEVHNVLRMW